MVDNDIEEARSGAAAVQPWLGSASFGWAALLTVVNMVVLLLELGWAWRVPEAYGLWGLFFLQVLVNGGVLTMPPRTRPIGIGILTGALVTFLAWFAFELAIL